MRHTRLQTLAILAAATIAAAGEAQNTAISADGVIESKSGGFKFPNGTVQTTAAGATDPCANQDDPSDEMIQVGGVCIDKYEASVWSQPDGGIQYGVDADGDLEIDPGTEYPCSENGQDCFGLIYARSLPGVQPSQFITWFQAQQALANSGKRLPTSAEWQMAVAGTPDNTNCNVSTGSISDTAVFGNCVSDWGAFDMVGNLAEWVADWVPASTACPGWDSFSDDTMCLSGASTSATGPGILARGGNFRPGTNAGPFAVNGLNQPSDSFSTFGFRGAR